MQNENEWLKERVAYIRGLKSPSDQQAILAELATKQTREPSEEKKLSALVKAEKASIRAAKARQQAANLIHAEKKAEREAERKARNHRLILQGVLFDLPNVVEGAQAMFDREGVANRTTIVSGDFFTAVPEGADAYFLKFIIHDL